MTIAISVFALTLSLATFVTSRWRDLLLRLRDRLATADQQRGRGRTSYSRHERSPWIARGGSGLVLAYSGHADSRASQGAGAQARLETSANRRLCALCR